MEMKVSASGRENAEKNYGASSSLGSTERVQNNMAPASSLATTTGSAANTLDPMAARKHLQKARTHGRRRLLFLRGPTLILGSALVTVGLVATFFPEVPGLRLIGVLGQFLGGPMLGLSLLPSDKVAVRYCAAVFIGGFSIITLSDALEAVALFETAGSGDCTREGGDVPCWNVFLAGARYGVNALVQAGAVIGISWILCRKPSSETLLRPLPKATWEYFLWHHRRIIPSRCQEGNVRIACKSLQQIFH